MRILFDTNVVLDVFSKSRPVRRGAHLAGADGIVTRNAADFSEATPLVYTPTELRTILDDRRD